MTDHITLPRSVVEQAIENFGRIMEAHRFNVASMPVTKVHAIAFDAREALRAALTAQQAEPAAYLWQHGETGRTRILMPDEVFTDNSRWFLVGPLYTAPQPAQQVEVPHGWKLVPVEPTPEMCRALFINLTHADDETRVIKAVLNAAPTPPAATMPKGWVMPTEAEIDEYIEDYEMRGDGSDYRPTEQERFVIKDAIMGLLAESFKGHATAPPAATVPVLEPLTDEELRDALRQCPHDAVENLRVRWLYAKDFARAVEAAHNDKLAKRGGA